MSLTWDFSSMTARWEARSLTQKRLWHGGGQGFESPQLHQRIHIRTPVFGKRAGVRRCAPLLCGGASGRGFRWGASRYSRRHLARHPRRHRRRHRHRHGDGLLVQVERGVGWSSTPAWHGWLSGLGHAPSRHPRLPFSGCSPFDPTTPLCCGLFSPGNHLRVVHAKKCIPRRMSDGGRKDPGDRRLLAGCRYRTLWVVRVGSVSGMRERPQ
jgi:hypothetical protein